MPLRVPFRSTSSSSSSSSSHPSPAVVAGGCVALGVSALWFCAYAKKCWNVRQWRALRARRAQARAEGLPQPYAFYEEVRSCRMG
jgi:hypothetical protein